MVIEKLFLANEIYSFPLLYVEGRNYRCSDSSRTFYSQYEYWYDGRLFLIGSFSSNELVMVDKETGASAVTQQDFQRKPSVWMLIKKFKEKLEKSGKTIHEVIRDYKNCNLDLELWLVNSLII